MTWVAWLSYAREVASSVYVLEVNPRASRTVPFLTKVTGVPLTRVATQVILGGTLRERALPVPSTVPRIRGTWR